MIVNIIQVYELLIVLIIKWKSFRIISILGLFIEFFVHALEQEQ